MNHEFSIDGLFDFLNAGVSAFHSTAAAAAILEENGYQNCPESAAWELVPSWLLGANIIPPATALPSWHGGCPRVR